MHREGGGMSFVTNEAVSEAGKHIVKNIQIFSRVII